MNIVFKKTTIAYSFTLILTFGILLGGCRTIPFAQTGQTFPKYDGVVKVYEEKPEVAYQEIGIFSSVHRYTLEDATIIADLQKHAAKKGANAIYFLSLRDYPPSYYENNVGSTKITVMAIRVLEE